MPVRAIPKNYRNLTGRAASLKSEHSYFESTLERDMLTLLDFDNQVLSYEVQPVAISWQDSQGKKRTYTPDVLAHFAQGSCSFSSKSNVLIEVKYRDDIKKNWVDYKPKFKAAIQYANNMGWRFKLMTEVEIRTPLMENARFLLPYIPNDHDTENVQLVLQTIAQERSCTVQELLATITTDKWIQAEFIPILWKLIGTRRIGTDLTRPLTMTSTIWLGA